MTKKDYIILAEAFGKAAKSLEVLDSKTFGACVNWVGIMLKEDSPNFDVQKFYTEIMLRSTK